MIHSATMTPNSTSHPESKTVGFLQGCKALCFVQRFYLLSDRFGTSALAGLRWQPSSIP
ncbi:hypothetical protein [Calothrix sp. PCC 6303]|uniref:hypothetical protein n=1 Tax=Calothrix sp. PCC 6303 TaxID=1170562 RepID=UPI00130D90C1|nr:hypothetical protein [Calothrix sp. PCC 6303]